MTKSVENIENRLKDIVDKKGPSYLTEEPFEVYRELLDSVDADKKTVDAVLHFLVSGLPERAFAPDADPVLFSGLIQEECSFNKKMSDRLATIFLSLYSKKNEKEWEERKFEGLRQFLKENFTCTWNGFSIWDEGNGTIDCYYKAEIVLSPTEMIAADKELTALLKKNPFLEREIIQELFAGRLSEYLDDQFEEYCTADDYYQPVVEDFGINMNYDLPKWCSENGFEVVSCDGDGGDDGYEPKFRNGWY